jgi:hypothetical protein
MQHRKIMYCNIENYVLQHRKNIQCHIEKYVLQRQKLGTVTSKIMYRNISNF